MHCWKVANLEHELIGAIEPAQKLLSNSGIRQDKDYNGKYVAGIPLFPIPMPMEYIVD